MAKKIKSVYDFCNDISRKYQSGLVSVSEFNRFFNVVQTELLNYLISIHAINQQADEYISPFKATEDVTCNTSGLFAKPPAFNYFLSASYEGKPIHILTSNQVDTYEQLPQRRTDLTKKRVNIEVVDGGWQSKLDTATEIKVRYIKDAPEAKLVFTLSSTDDEDILTYDENATVDTIFKESCINLLAYMTLEKIGISVREQLLQEYSQLGISKESIRQ